MSRIAKLSARLRAPRNLPLAPITVAGLVLLSACAQTPPQQTSKLQVGTIGGQTSGPALPDPARQAWHVARITVSVPSGLSVSRIPDDRYPDTDIVWWGDPEGDGAPDRRAQVATIVAEAASQAAGALGGPRPALLEIEVLRFHALSPASRDYGAWGFHDLDFALTLREPESGLVIDRVALIEADLDAYQRGEARAADARGETQRVRITRRIAEVAWRWLNTGR